MSGVGVNLGQHQRSALGEQAPCLAAQVERVFDAAVHPHGRGGSDCEANPAARREVLAEQLVHPQARLLGRPRAAVVAGEPAAQVIGFTDVHLRPRTRRRQPRATW